MIRTLRNRLSEEVVFAVSLMLALTTSLFVRPSFSSIDWHVLLALFTLMGAVLGLERARLFDHLAISLVSRFTNERSVGVAMVLLTGILSMVVTNDVALICLVPLMLIIANKGGFDPLWTVILQTLAANIGSTLTPMGNPQNLYLFSFYHLSPSQLVGSAIPFVAFGMLGVVLLALLVVPRQPIAFHVRVERKPGKRRVFLYSALFLAGVAGVFRLLPIWLAAVAVLLALLLFDRPLLRKIDGFLLLTFLCFFVAIGNLTQLPALTALAGRLLSTPQGAYAAGLLLSQGISNVPAALLLAPFTQEWKAVFLGVNIGGMGTLIASMASLISYRLYARHHQHSNYLAKFHLINFCLLLLFGTAFFFLL